MTIDISLGESSINSLIRRLEEAKENIDNGTANLIDTLVTEGSAIAQDAYGSMARAEGSVDGNVGTITASGEAAGFAEFGAGNAVVPVLFTNGPSFPVDKGSYSRLRGSGEYDDHGFWFFGGEIYFEVPARMGLFQAKRYIIRNAGRIAREEIRP